jgi:hypothetical protein
MSAYQQIMESLALNTGNKVGLMEADLHLNDLYIVHLLFLPLISKQIQHKNSFPHKKSTLQRIYYNSETTTIEPMNLKTQYVNCIHTDNSTTEK